MLINCHKCGKEFERKPFLIKKHELNFCSRECYLSNGARTKKICSVCGRAHYKSFHKRIRRALCSEKCYKQIINLLKNISIEKYRNRRQREKKAYRTQRKIQRRIDCQLLNDDYIRKCISDNRYYNVKNSEIPNKLIVLYRNSLKLRRAINEKRKLASC